MSNPKKPVPFAVPADLAERSRAANMRVAAGEPMTVQQLADALGMPFEFVAVAIGMTEVLMSGQPVLIDPAKLSPLN
jgi:hypothetical protein